MFEKTIFGLPDLASLSKLCVKKKTSYRIMQLYLPNIKYATSFRIRRVAVC